jgi:hypothetical protein
MEFSLKVNKSAHPERNITKNIPYNFISGAQNKTGENTL